MSELNRVAYQIAARDSVWPMLPVVMADIQTGEILEVHRSAAETFGYTVDELMRQSVEVLVPDAVRDMHALWRQDVRVPESRLLGTSRIVHGKKKDGTLIMVHVGLSEVEVLGRSIGVAFVVDLSALALAAGDPLRQTHRRQGDAETQTMRSVPTSVAEDEQLVKELTSEHPELPASAFRMALELKRKMAVQGGR